MTTVDGKRYVGQNGFSTAFYRQITQQKELFGYGHKKWESNKVTFPLSKSIASSYRFVVERGIVVVDVPLFIVELSRERVRRLLFPVVPLPLRSVLFIESLPFIVEPLCIVPVPVE